MKKRSGPPDVAPLQLNGRLHPEWKMYFEQFLSVAETQDDAVAAAGNPPTQTEFNDLVDVVNGLIDKLQAAGVME